ncbi:hypothetical protein C5167_007452 [Papaver somniferum]|nr:hypothetical protein C5167_007452 [Papaver somniferum]
MLPLIIEVSVPRLQHPQHLNLLVPWGSMGDGGLGKYDSTYRVEYRDPKRYCNIIHILGKIGFIDVGLVVVYDGESWSSSQPRKLIPLTVSDSDDYMYVEISGVFAGSGKQGMRVIK